MSIEEKISNKGDRQMKALVTGGAGFVGCNYAWHLLNKAYEVVVFDNFARGSSCSYNVEWLKSHPNSDKLSIIRGNVKDYELLSKSAKDCDLIVHTAAQVSVPLSVSNPRNDFECNTLGAFNVLEVARGSRLDPIVIYTSSNKVYGMPNAELIELDRRYDFKELLKGVDEFHSLKGEEPYGVSKIVGDLYARAYNLRYGLKTVAFRCSCMYGPHQWGKEEQGWVAWFCIAFAVEHPITIFGNGKQVRDLIYVEDVIRAFDLAIKNIKHVAGESLNLGGGKENAVSLLEVIDFLGQLTAKTNPLFFTDWRPGDNKCYYTNYAKIRRLLGWQPHFSWKDGISRTYEWVQNNLPLVRDLYTQKT